MVNRRHSCRRFAPSCFANSMNSRRCDTTDTSWNGTDASPETLAMRIGCVRHVPEHLSAISPVCTPARGEGTLWVAAVPKLGGIEGRVHDARASGGGR